MEACSALKEITPKLAIVFASGSYEDLAGVPRIMSELLRGVPVVGGTSGACVIGPGGVARRATTSSAPRTGVIAPRRNDVLRAATHAATNAVLRS
jgi:hypothetical protein